MSDRMYRRIAAMTLAAVTTTLFLAGCGSDAICGSEDYPVIQINGPGKACERKGTDPGPGYARFPEGKVPQHVDDKWDVYWRSHTVNQAGDIIDLPPVSRDSGQPVDGTPSPQAD